MSERYDVRLRPAARRDLDRIGNPSQKRLHKALSELAVEPRGNQTKKLAGADQRYRARAGDYRILFEIDDAIRRVTVARILHRKDAYRNR